MVEKQDQTIIWKADTSMLEHSGTQYEDLEEFDSIVESDLKETKVCGRCNREVDDIFPSEICDHEVCLDCRFKDSVKCLFCTTDKKNEIGPTIEIDASLLYNFKKKKHINKDHIVDVQQESVKSLPKQMCTVCQRVFLKTNARYHYACATGEKPLQCTECGHRFVKKSHLESHLNSHYGIKPFKCTVTECNASFTQKDKLVRHMKTHAPEKHICTICHKAYSSLPILHFHMQKVHSTSKLYKCDMCPRMYKYQRTLKVHRLKHQELKEHLCEICGKKYAVAAQLKQHKHSHIPISQRPFKCRRQCKQRFITRHDKARHELIHDHTSSPDFECSLCNITFGRKDNLERHMKNLHQVPWNFKKSAKMTAIVLPFNMNKSSLDHKILFNLNKNNKYMKKNNENITDNRTMGNRIDKIFKTVENYNKEKLNQPEINYTGTVLSRPSVIVSKFESSGSSLNEKPCMVSKNVINPYIPPNNSSTSYTTDKVVNIKHYKSPKLQNKMRTILNVNDLSRIICHTNSLKEDYSSTKLAN